MMAKSKINSAHQNQSRRFNSFFAGIGGFDLAFEKENFKAAFYCENNEFCRNILGHHWPDVENATDICDLNAHDIPFADVWTAGFPCQDLSLARTPHGKRSGLKGERSGLFYNFLDLLAVQHPQVVLLENVSGLLNSHKGNDFDALVRSLTQLGYAVAWRVLNARYFGVPQSRPRIFICAWKDSPENAAQALFEDSVATKPKHERLGFLTESKCSETGLSVPQLSYCISATSGRHTGLDWARSYVAYENRVRRLTPLECERLQGFPDNWTAPPGSLATPLRGEETNRYHAIGNAVCVPVVQWIAARIFEILKQERQRTLNFNQFSDDTRLSSLAGSRLSSSYSSSSFPLAIDEKKWASGGIAYKNHLVMASVSSSPGNPLKSRLIDLVEKKEVDQRYFLSTNAVQGILRRVDKLGRNLFPPLDATLRKMVLPLPNRSKSEAAERNEEYATL
jgi:DNA (cytosine-5)-methyltransferase 1